MTLLPRKSVSVLSTGGTIAMLKTSKGYRPKPGHLAKSMERIPELQNADMPLYTVTEFDSPIDSANMTPFDWYRIGQHILNNYDHYDGFVILHGTDTMAYTAAALSFMLENLSKPVIFTGSQLPLFETRNDARENLINAILLAGRYLIPEVCIYFNNKLFRGNRTTKIDATSFSAFASPNFPALGKVGTDIHIRQDLLCIKSNEPLHLQSIKPIKVCTLRIFPGIPPEMLKTILQLPLDALILETYGVGNAPEDPAFIQLIQEAADQGRVIINCSQCIYTKVKMDEYATGSGLLRAGVLSGGDMTIDAAITKLFYLFSKNIGLAELKERMALNLRGELTRAS
jgi:L-asparaginase